MEGNTLTDVESDLGTMDKEEVPADERNPMLNHLVMERFFELCDSSDLKNVRLVSKQWFELSLTRWRKEKQVRIEGNFRNLRPNTVTLCSPKMMEKPYKSYLLREFDFEVSSSDFRAYFHPQAIEYLRALGKIFSLFHRTMFTFWKICGSSIHRLELSNCKFPPKFEDVTQLISGLPNLEVLIVRSPVLESYGYPIPYFEEWERMINEWQPPLKLKSIRLYIDLTKCCILSCNWPPWKSENVWSQPCLYSGLFETLGMVIWEGWTVLYRHDLGCSESPRLKISFKNTKFL